MSSHLKNEISASDFEVASEDSRIQSKLRLVRTVDTLRIGLSIVALCVGVVVLGLSGDVLYVYNATSLPADFLISLWPEKVDMRPTYALVTCGAIVVVANGLALVLSKVSAVSMVEILYIYMKVLLFFLVYAYTVNRFDLVPLQTLPSLWLRR
jgi:hypothetical protein